MSTHYEYLKTFLADLLRHKSPETLLEGLKPKADPQPVRKIGGKGENTPENIRERWKCIDGLEDATNLYAGEDGKAYEANIENFIGTVKVPVGLAGPLRVRGMFANADYLLPMATTEAALVASYHRGASLITKAGGCTTIIMAEGVTRSPGFAFANMSELAIFSNWILHQEEELARVANATTRHGKLQDLKLNAQGNNLYLLCDFYTGDAAGQNMVTIATQAICEFILKNTPVQPKYWFVEANASGDKKACAQSFNSVRGKKVSAEVHIPGKLVGTVLHSSARDMVNYWRMSAIGGVMTGTIGIQGHYANGLAALFIACGQDVACVSEAAVGITRFEEVDNGDLYASVTLPNLIVGTVGGGTGLPSQKSCLQILGLSGAGHARAFAEVCAGAALSGEVSIIGALAAGHFTRAHHDLARGRARGRS